MERDFTLLRELQETQNRKQITFSDGKHIGTLKLKGTRDLNFYTLKDVKRVRLVKRQGKRI